MTRSFEDAFGRRADAAYFSPGRLNLLGEHTDYNGGHVLPAAIHLGNRFEMAERDDGRVRIFSDAFDEIVEFDLRNPPEKKRGHWSDYFAGVACELDLRQRPVNGYDVGVFSTLPTGSGLSSSASITTGFAFALSDQLDLSQDRVALSKLAQRVENQYIGLNCGILDQLSVALGQPGHVLHIDCTSLAWEIVPFDAGKYTLLSADTGVPRSLAASHYNTRRQECERAASLLGADNSSVSSLSQVSIADLENCAALADNETLMARARHIVTENDRVKAAVRHLQKGNMIGVGGLMVESHESLSRDYEVSCAELDIMVEEATRIDGVIGAKMTGGGFGGAVVAIVDAGNAADISRRLADAYESRAKRQASIIECHPSAGIRQVRAESR